MRATRSLLAASAIAVVNAVNSTSTLASVCTVANVQANLPADGFVQGTTLNKDSVTANAVYNTTVTGSVMFRRCFLSFRAQIIS